MLAALYSFAAPFEDAKQLADSGKFEEAYQVLKQAPGTDAAYHYNVGTIMMQLGKPGAAVAYLEKAHYLKPFDRDIRANLKQARDALGRLIGNERVDPASSALESFAEEMPLGPIAGLLGILALVAVALTWRNRETPSTARTACAVLFIALVAVGVVRGLGGAEPPAMVLESQAIRSGPGEKFLELSRADSGMKLRLTGTAQGDWRQVRFSDEGIGWIPMSSLLLF